MDKFLIRESFYNSIRFIEPPAVRLAVYDTLFDVGIKGENHLNEFPISDRDKALARLPLRHILLSVSEANERYKNSVKYGREGGLKGGKLGGRGNKKEDRELNVENDKK